MTPLDLVPRPRTAHTAQGEGFTLGPRTALDTGPGTGATAHRIRAELGAATAAPLLPPDGTEQHVLALRLDPALGPEAYRLTVGAGRAEITGGAAPGVYWGAQTLRQLLPPRAWRRAGDAEDGAATAPPVRIEDAPRFPWRGFMLDVARHFTPKEGVLRVLDLLAAHKLNVFHFHLTDDQGWRIEIRRHPRLTTVGAVRSRTRVGHRASELWDPQPHGGHYTQDDIREIVAYAAARHITVVPEIDIPGHSQAAIAAYPFLGNADAVDTEALEPWTDWGVNPNVLAPTDAVLRFYEEVLEEVLELFPSPYVHIGGDECPDDQWAASPAARARMAEEGVTDPGRLQDWFNRHFGAWLAARGRRLVGWDEILQSRDPRTGAGEPGADRELPPGAVVSSWRGYSGGVAAAEAGHDVIMCPEQHVYLNHRQDGGPDEPAPIGFVRTLRDVYLFEPLPPRLAGTPHAAHVLGTQANLWTECVDTQQRLDYLAFPRLCAFAEVAWSALPPPAERDFADFERRMTAAHYARLDALGVKYRPPSGPYPWQRRTGVLGRPLDGPPPIV
ncbi:beta-N-acetylhexosaminidase [Streptomyces boncukensis]|uniref:beta-N-acetylhexosaminidase n=1 Tax=Streptomyces boncukensis TaxID=2711219 RepID=A0A6G4X062_9ACTN|nr:beta-N-acetylhexosaminidase [Streptomyces boncukensis]NGO70939.1 beta-N-acetylhexosaminidase [Streptomyces boncukensis]